MLKRLTNKETDQVDELVKAAGLHLDECPTCHSRNTQWEPDVYGRVNGTYKLWGVEYPCDCDDQIQLYRHYLLAGIGDQYQRLNWNDFTGSQEAKEAVSVFLDKWENFKQHGMGVEFSSPNLGVGKTFAATHLGKQLVQLGERVFFTPFLDIMGAYQREDADEYDEFLRNVTWLILDEVRPPWTDRQGALFSDRFEALVRHRQNYNRPVIMTTNLTPEQLNENYPRTYSLLEAKQVRVEMTGEDVRQGKIAQENLELLIAGEVRPIS